MTPVENMAARLSLLRNISPPVDVMALAKSLATVLVRELPDWFSTDGITLDLKSPAKRPTILVNSRTGYHRQRFTIAHEIGHILIPWHIGDIIDNLSFADERSNSRYRRMEAEANRFAAELLMPSQWVSDICKRALNLRGAVITVTEVADVSLSAAALRVIQFGPPGYILAHIRNERVSLIGQTRGTRATLPDVGVTSESVQFSAFEELEPFVGNSSSIRIWKELERMNTPNSPDRDWRTILNEMLNCIPIERRDVAQSRVNAILGYPIGQHPPGTAPEVIYKSVVKAFENRTDRDTDVTTLRSHSLFDDYVLARIYERSEKK